MQATTWWEAVLALVKEYGLGVNLHVRHAGCVTIINSVYRGKVFGAVHPYVYEFEVKYHTVCVYAQVAQYVRHHVGT